MTAASTATALLAPLVAGAVANPLTEGNTRNERIRTSTGLGGGTDINVIIGKFINVALSVLGILLLVYLLYAGFLWMTSDGEKGVEKAQGIIKNSIIGLIIIVVSFALSNFILSSLATATAG